MIESETRIDNNISDINDELIIMNGGYMLKEITKETKKENIDQLITTIKSNYQ